MANKTVTVLGGGVGGLVTANRLRERLGTGHRVVLIDRSDKHTFWPSLLWVQVGLREPERIVRDLARLERKGIEVVQAGVEAIDPERKSVRAGGKEIESDYVVISLGADLAPETIPGLAEAGHNLYSMAGATAIRDARKAVTEGRLVVLTARVPYKCPAAPYEAAMLLDYDLRKRKVRERVEVAVYAAEPAPMGVAGPEASQGVRSLIEERDIDYHPQHQIAKADPTSKTLHFSNGAEARYDLLAYVPPHVAPKVVRDAGLTGEGGWIGVDRHTMETPFPGVYAIGDVTGIPLVVGQPLPKAGVFAERQADAVARTIAAQVNGAGEPGRFEGDGECFVEVGGGKAGFGSGNFYGEPAPAVKFHKPTRYRHAAKVLFEKRWLRSWF